MSKENLAFLIGGLAFGILIGFGAHLALVPPELHGGAPETEAAGMTGAYPNPFRHSTRFSFELRFPGDVELAVYDVRGRLVRQLERGLRGSGTHQLEWDGRDDAGRAVATGVYYFRLRAAGLAYSRPVVLTR